MDVDQSAVLAALDSVVSVVRTEGPAEAWRLRARVCEHRLRPVEPIDLPGSLFGWLGVQDDEIRWSRWLANCLGDRTAIGQVAREAFCKAVGASISRRPPVGDCSGALPPDAAFWEFVSPYHWRVVPEYAAPEGRIDVFVSIPNARTTLGIEVKLWEGWHPGGDGEESQHLRYRRLIERLRPDGGFGALVILTCREDFVHEVPPDWVFLTWRDLGRALRRVLADHRIRDPMTLWPLLLGLGALEHHLLSLEPGALRREADASSILPLLAWLDYLEVHA